MKSSVREIKIELPEDVLLSVSISENQLVREYLPISFIRKVAFPVVQQLNWRECQEFSFCLKPGNKT